MREWARDGPETEALKEAKVELAELLAEDLGLFEAFRSFSKRFEGFLEAFWRWMKPDSTGVES